jgi:hypothetical protein
LAKKPAIVRIRHQKDKPGLVLKIALVEYAVDGIYLSPTYPFFRSDFSKGYCQSLFIPLFK